jgi:hypothetical protein
MSNEFQSSNIKNSDAENNDSGEEHNKKNVKKKLPLETSITHKKCITKCHGTNHTYLHPITFSVIKPEHTKGASTCAIYPSYDEDMSFLYEFGSCNIKDNETKYYLSEKDALLFRPSFNSKSFLHSIYGLLTFNQVIIWTLDNDNSNYKTIKRIHNAAWKEYGNNIENISDTVIDFYYELAKSNWLKDYIKNIKSNYSFDIFSDLETKNSDANIEKIIIDKYFSKTFFTQSVLDYINEESSEWKNIKSHYGNLKQFIYKSLIKQFQ